MAAGYCGWYYGIGPAFVRAIRCREQARSLWEHASPLPKAIGPTNPLALESVRRQ